MHSVHPGQWHVGVPNRCVDEAHEELEDPPHDVERNRMGQRQQGQSSFPMNPPSEMFIPIDQRKWKDTPAVNSVKKESLAWRISKMVTIDGAIDRCSLLPTLRREFEVEGAGVFSDSQWLSLLHRGSNGPRFQHCMDSNEYLMCRPRVTQEELWLISHC